MSSATRTTYSDHFISPRRITNEITDRPPAPALVGSAQPENHQMVGSRASCPSAMCEQVLWIHLHELGPSFFERRQSQFNAATIRPRTFPHSAAARNRCLPARSAEAGCPPDIGFEANSLRSARSRAASLERRPEWISQSPRPGQRDWSEWYTVNA